jgi:hypothetical protein
MKPLLTKKEMDAVEDRFFCECSDEEYEKMLPILQSVWEKLCKNAGDK